MYVSGNADKITKQERATKQTLKRPIAPAAVQKDQGLSQTEQWQPRIESVQVIQKLPWVVSSFHFKNPLVINFKNMEPLRI